MDYRVLMAIEIFPLESWLRSKGGLEQRKGEWLLYCPQCDKLKLTVNSDRKAWHCWVCQQYETRMHGGQWKRIPTRGAGGLIDLLVWMDGVSRQEAIEEIVRATSVRSADLNEMPEFDLKTDQPRHNIRSTVPIPFPDGATQITSILPYMAKRGLTLNDVANYGIYFCNDGRYRNRLVFPVWEDGAHVYYQARAMWEARPGERIIKALNPPAYPGAAVSSDVLFNLDHARRYKRVVVAEAPIDAIKIGLDAVATFGKMLHPAQVSKLLLAGVKALDLMWDADAHDDMRRAALQLSGVFDIRLVLLPSGDPGERMPEENRYWIERAEPVSRQRMLLEL